jgi:cell division protein FtsI/penicillin-binding protein 2
LALGFLFITLHISPNVFRTEEQKSHKMARIREDVKIQISELLFQNIYPTHIEVKIDGDRQRVEVEYTLNADIQSFTDRLINSYKPDYAAVVLMDASTGEILSLNSFTRDESFKQNLALLATYPAASIFKIIPATAAIDKYNYDHDLKIAYNGSNHTLYKRNVMGETNRWSRFLTLEDAFALSVNTVFAKLALNKLEPHDLEEYTRRFLFNQPILTDFPVEVSSATVPNEKSYLMAEVASGFNKINKLSPVQGAMIAASIANEGLIQLPYIVKSLRDRNGKVVFQAESQELARPISAQSAKELKKLMEATVVKGTSKKSFKPLLMNKKLMPMELGGKTGSLTGDNPKGKVDWFVGYAIKDDRRLAIAAITVNKEYWTVKAAFLAQEIFKRYFNEQAKVASRMPPYAKK